MFRFLSEHPWSRFFLCKGVWVFTALFFLIFASFSRAESINTLSTGATVSGTYTDNPTSSGSDIGSDFYSEFNPWLHYRLERKKSQLGISYDPSLRYYFSEQDYFLGHNLGIDAAYQPQQHLTTRFSNSFMVSEDAYDTSEPVFTRTEEGLVIEDPTLRTGKRTYYSNNLRQSLLYRFGPSNEVNLDYTFGLLENDDPSLEDNLHHGPGIDISYWWNADYGTELGGSYTRGEYSNDSPSVDAWTATARLIRRLNPHLNIFLEHNETYVRYEHQGADADQRDNEVFDANLGVDYGLSETTFLTLKAGYFYEQAEGEDSISGFQINGDMARQFKRGSVRLSGGTGTEQNLFGAENLGFTRYYRANVAGEYRFTKLCNGNTSLQYQLNTYEADGRDDTTYTWNNGIHYLIRPWLTATLSYVYRMVNSTDIENDYTENRVSFSLSFTPTRPFRLD
jgi:hypothetical protein